MPDEFVNVRYMVGDVDDAVAFYTDIISGPGARQILLDDPAGNPVELFQPAGT